jgi:hypothetical protein
MIGTQDAIPLPLNCFEVMSRFQDLNAATAAELASSARSFLAWSSPLLLRLSAEGTFGRPS